MEDEKLDKALSIIEAVVALCPTVLPILVDLFKKHDAPTLADFEALRDRVPLPETYLEAKPRA